MIEYFQNVVHLHRLKARVNPIGAVNALHLLPLQPVAGHPVRTVGGVQLEVLVDTEVVVPLLLVTQLFQEGGNFHFFSHWAARFFRICWN